MKCPNCKGKLGVPTYALINMSTYQSNCLVRTNCCDTLIKMEPVMSYKSEKYNGDKTTDDWGN